MRALGTCGLSIDRPLHEELGLVLALRYSMPKDPLDCLLRTVDRFFGLTGYREAGWSFRWSWSAGYFIVINQPDESRFVDRERALVSTADAAQAHHWVLNFPKLRPLVLYRWIQEEIGSSAEVQVRLPEIRVEVKLTELLRLL